MVVFNEIRLGMVSHSFYYNNYSLVQNMVNQGNEK
ncbi:MAG: hypothetical protein FD166_2909 [Bacteroidetes bacterium]|nr:MAG: hypothetical protein FD166_2909 [Bacteroidota bacterium]